MDLHLILIRLFKSTLLSLTISEFSSVFKVIDLMEMVASGKAPQATKDEVFSVELQSQVGN